MERKEQPYNIHTLDNGLRVVCRQRAGLVSYIGVVINAGSSDESSSHEGLAHFVEHTIFKGTDKRRAWQISSHMESIGGELNAYTSKEETMVYTNAPSGYEERAVELIYDLVGSSVFPKAEIDKEREVVIEEIYSYLDSPSDRIFDEFEELAYKGSGLSHNILGSPESVRTLKSEDCRGFIDRYYIAPNMVVYCVTPLPEERMLKLVNKYFGKLPRKESSLKRILPPPLEIFDEYRDKGNHQANTIMGTRTFGRKDARRFPLFLLNNHLAGPCMNSLLNRELREKRGYVYTVDSTVSLLSETGLMQIYFGCDPSNVKRCRKIIEREIDRLCQNTFSETSFNKIKRQYCGQLIASSDHIENRAMSLGKSVLYFDKINDISSTIGHIMEVTPAQMRDVAEEILGPRLSVLTLS